MPRLPPSTRTGRNTANRGGTRRHSGRFGSPLGRNGTGRNAAEPGLRSRKPLRVVRLVEGSNPSLSAKQAGFRQHSGARLVSFRPKNEALSTRHLPYTGRRVRHPRTVAESFQSGGAWASSGLSTPPSEEEISKRVRVDARCPGRPCLTGTIGRLKGAAVRAIMRANLGSPVDPELARPESGSASLPAAPAPHLQTIDRGDEGAKAVPFHLVGPAWEGRERAGFGERLRPQPRSARSIPGLEPGCHRHHPQQFLSPISRSRADKGSTAENRRFGGRVDAPAADFLAPPEEGGGVWPGVGCLAAVLGCPTFRRLPR